VTWSAASVRAWAVGCGLYVPRRGPVPSDVLAAYLEWRAGGELA
jgi:hypothetical protein